MPPSPDGRGQSVRFVATVNIFMATVPVVAVTVGVMTMKMSVVIRTEDRTSPGDTGGGGGV